MKIGCISDNKQFRFQFGVGIEIVRLLIFLKSSMENESFLGWLKSLLKIFLDKLYQITEH